MQDLKEWLYLIVAQWHSGIGRLDDPGDPERLRQDVQGLRIRIRDAQDIQGTRRLPKQQVGSAGTAPDRRPGARCGIGTAAGDRFADRSERDAGLLRVDGRIPATPQGAIVIRPVQVEGVDVGQERRASNQGAIPPSGRLGVEIQDVRIGVDHFGRGRAGPVGEFGPEPQAIRLEFGMGREMDRIEQVHDRGDQIRVDLSARIPAHEAADGSGDRQPGPGAERDMRWDEPGRGQGARFGRGPQGAHDQGGRVTVGKIDEARGRQQVDAHLQRVQIGLRPAGEGARIRGPFERERHGASRRVLEGPPERLRLGYPAAPLLRFPPPEPAPDPARRIAHGLGQEDTARRCVALSPGLFECRFRTPELAVFQKTAGVRQDFPILHRLSPGTPPCVRTGVSRRRGVLLRPRYSPVCSARRSPCAPPCPPRVRGSVRAPGPGPRCRSSPRPGARPCDRGSFH